MTDTPYNGYTNYETWLLCLNIDNEQGIYDSVNEFVEENKELDNYDLADMLKEFLEEWFYVEEHSIYKICDSWTFRDWQEINWVEVVETRRGE
jgi:ferritin